MAAPDTRVSSVDTNEGKKLVTVSPNYGRVPTALLEDSRLSAGAIRLFAILDDYTNRESHACFPSVEAIMDRMGVSRATIERLRSELEEHGWIDRIERFKDGRQTSNTYRVHFIPIGGLTDEPQVKSEPPEGLKSEPLGGLTDEPQNQTHRNQTHKNQTSSLKSTAKPKRKSPQAKPLAPLDEQDFAAWWKQYPRKASKSAARKAWHKIVSENQQSAVSDALANYIESLATYERIEGKPQTYVMHPSTFLNGEWEDWAEGVNLDRWGVQAEPEVDPNDPRRTNPHAYIGEVFPELAEDEPVFHDLPPHRRDEA